MSLLQIANGTVYDPANGVEGVVQDIWIESGRIVAAPTDPNVRPSKVLDATGLIVMPGGVDMHSHIVEQGEIRQEVNGRTLHVQPE
jgi:formylmethanofuran dehydrogenase subunit A